MSVETGTRPGTKKTDRIPGSDHICCEGPEWDKIRGNDREVQRYNAAVNTAITNLEKAYIAANIALCMLHGGHIDKGKMAMSGVRKDWTPAQVLNHVERLRSDPDDLVKKALNI